MKKVFIITMLACIATIGSAQEKKAAEPAKPAAQAAPAAPPTINSLMHRQVNNIEKAFVGAAEAMPADKFFYAPSGEGFKEVRTFAQQIGHVAANNFLFAGTLTGEDPKVSPDDRKNGPSHLKTRDDYIKYLKDSFAAAHKAVDTINESNAMEQMTFHGNPNAKMARLALGNIFIWHGYDHYGQMVVYLRNNGVVPPASRN
jgi:uncharacterized damage-inducible protein DinB